MELVEGEPLKGPLPVGTAQDYAKQIADAPEAAHEKGIVHRDFEAGQRYDHALGVVKVLDFGLAAIPQTSAGDASNPANSPYWLARRKASVSRRRTDRKIRAGLSTCP